MSKQDIQSEDFTGWRKIFWPVHKYELKKVMPLALMMFFVLFNYTILRDAKDGLIITAPGSGAEAISFLKLYGTLTFAIIFVAIYSKLSLILSKQNLFYTMITIFIVFFSIFGYVLFPLKNVLHASPDTIKGWIDSYPRLHWIMPLIGNWTYSLFYIFSELWGTIGLSILFWQLANDITSLKESKRFYPLFGIIGNVGILCSGYLLYDITAKYAYLNPIERWDISLFWIISALIASMLIIVYIYRWIQNNVITDPLLYTPKTEQVTKDKKIKLSFFESIKVVFSSKYIGCIMLIIVSYGVCINLIEVTWKSQMKLQFPDTAQYVEVMGIFSMTTGIATIILMVAGSNILRRFGWFAGAIATPIMLLITGGGFFGFIIFRDATAGILAMLSVTPLLMAVILGWAQNVMTKGVKYSLFDPTKDMAYIPLPDQLRTLGKAAADGIGGRLGKSGGAIIQQILLVSMIGSTQVTITPILAVICFIGVGVWLLSVVNLNKEFVKITNPNLESRSDDIKSEVNKGKEPKLQLEEEAL